MPPPGDGFELTAEPDGYPAGETYYLMRKDLEDLSQQGWGREGVGILGHQ